MSNAPWFKTGYGQQTAIWAPRLASLGHDVAIAGYSGMQHAHADWHGIPVYAASPENVMGQDVIGYYYEKHQADVVIALTDCWAMSPRMMRLLRTVAWTPVDTDPLGRGIADFAAESGAAMLAMSEFGRQVMGEAGIEADCIPHGIDVGLFSPPPDREALRAASGIPEGCFAVGINQANRSGLRKALPEQLVAFARFHRRHPDSRLLLHMAKNHAKGQDLPMILDKLSIGEDAVYFPDQGVYAAGEIGMEEMPRWYGALDVLLGCAMAEGFGLPLLESQACGTPVIATDGSAMTEVAAPGWLVEGQPFWVEQQHESWWVMPSVAGIDAALEAAWQAREDGSIEQVREQSREHALQYDADLILAERWKPYLEGIEATL
jgi:glycosyltransferase involved in cell wall biosynthesis